MNQIDKSQTRIRAIEGKTIFELEDKLKEFFVNKIIIASPIFEPKTKSDTWKSMVYYNDIPTEIFDKTEKKETKESPEIPATDKQINYLKKNNIDFPEGITKIEAHKIISENEKKREKEWKQKNSSTS